jgi:hypothetical protein
MFYIMLKNLIVHRARKRHVSILAAANTKLPRITRYYERFLIPLERPMGLSRVIRGYIVFRTRVLKYPRVKIPLNQNTLGLKYPLK